MDDLLEVRFKSCSTDTEGHGKAWGMCVDVDGVHLHGNVTADFQVNGTLEIFKTV
jgi:hypothetical protein